MVVAGREVRIIGGVDVGLDSSAVGVDANVRCRMPGPGGGAYSGGCGSDQAAAEACDGKGALS